MSLAVAIPCGVLAAVVYGGTTAVQHSAANTGTGQSDARALARLLRDPRWLLSVGGDAVGLILQVIALSTGPVVLIQPLLVLAVPVSLPAGWLLGGPRPRGRDFLACGAIVAGLGVFFAIVGDPGTSAIASTRGITVTVIVALVAGGVASLAVRRGAPALRAGIYGGVAGAWFGVVGVLLNAVSDTWVRHGVAGFGHPGGWVPLAGLLACGGLGMLLTQVSFQIGALAASFPANEATAPVVAVILGAVLLHEDVPISVPIVIVYLACLAAIVIGTMRLADTHATADGPAVQP